MCGCTGFSPGMSQHTLQRALLPQKPLGLAPSLQGMGPKMQKNSHSHSWMCQRAPGITQGKANPDSSMRVWLNDEIGIKNQRVLVITFNKMSWMWHRVCTKMSRSHGGEEFIQGSPRAAVTPDPGQPSLCPHRGCWHLPSHLSQLFQNLCLVLLQCSYCCSQP